MYIFLLLLCLTLNFSLWTLPLIFVAVFYRIVFTEYWRRRYLGGHPALTSFTLQLRVLNVRSAVILQIIHVTVLKSDAPAQSRFTFSSCAISKITNVDRFYTLYFCSLKHTSDSEGVELINWINIIPKTVLFCCLQKIFWRYRWKKTTAGCRYTRTHKLWIDTLILVQYPCTCTDFTTHG